MISPTNNMEIRGTDKKGNGSFAVSRGWRPHYGLDLVCEPGQVIVAPHGGHVNRIVQCYSDSKEFKGVEIISHDYISQVLYIYPVLDIVNADIQEGDTIGYAQKISKRYPGITEHIHWQIWVNPLLQLL